MDTLTPDQRSDRMRLVRGVDTKPEMVVRRLVHRLGYRFRKYRKDIPGRPDMAFPARRKVIFVHGCFWHRHKCSLGRLPKSRLEFWKKKLEGNRDRDARTLKSLRSAGWDVMVIWECQIRDADGVARRIRDFLDA